MLRCSPSSYHWKAIIKTGLKLVLQASHPESLSPFLAIAVGKAFPQGGIFSREPYATVSTGKKNVFQS